jgi:hypothetical protein
LLSGFEFFFKKLKHRNDFFNFLVNGSKKYAQILLNKILLFADEIFDPNFRHRDSSLAHVSKLLDGLF